MAIMAPFDAFPPTRRLVEIPPGFAPDVCSIPGVRLAPNPLTNLHAVVKNPYDLYPPLKLIWGQVEAKLAQLGPDQKLILLMGEEHKTVSHILLHAALLDRLAQYRDGAPDDPARSFIHAQEFPYNELSWLARYIGLDIPNHLQFTLHRHDPHGRMTREVQQAFNPYVEAPRAKEYLLDVGLRHKIPAAFVDLPRQVGKFGNEYLNPHDPVAQAIVKELWGREFEESEIDIVTPDGAGIRNVGIAKALGKLDARIIKLSTGFCHIVGRQNPQRYFPYPQSLMHLLEAAGHAVLALYPGIPDEGYRAREVLQPDALNAHQENLIVLEDLASERFKKNSPPGSEEEYIRRLAEAWSGAAYGFPCPFATKPAIPDQAEVRQKIQELITRAAPSYG